MKKRAKAIVGQCPHCHGLISFDQSTMNQVAEAALDAVMRVAEAREDVATKAGPFLVFHIPPTAATTGGAVGQR